MLMTSSSGWGDMIRMRLGNAALRWGLSQEDMLYCMVDCWADELVACMQPASQSTLPLQVKFVTPLALLCKGCCCDFAVLQGICRWRRLNYCLVMVAPTAITVGLHAKLGNDNKQQLRGGQAHSRLLGLAARPACDGSLQCVEDAQVDIVCTTLCIRQILQHKRHAEM